MIYSTSRCPHCNNVIRKETNPVYQIESPFEECPFCGKGYKNSYKEEWITKSPARRFLFYFKNGVFARAFLFSLFLGGGFYALAFPEGETKFLWLCWISVFSIWLGLSYVIRKKQIQFQIEESLERTKDPYYLSMLENSGYEIFPIDHN